MSIVMPVIVGAGPAGVRAAQALVAQGLRPVILDEAPRAGGQIYRQPPPGFQRAKPALYGFEHRKADAVHRAMNDMLAQVDYRPGSLVWNVEGKTLDVLQDGVSTAVPYTHLILATGATDRVLPFPGWLTPGVYTLGGSQVALKFQGCAIGSRVVFMGTGPLLYLVAYQYARAGAQVAAVLDTSRFTDRLAALPGMLRAPGLLAKGLYYMAWLRAHGVPLRSGVRPIAVQGQARVTGLSYRQGGREYSVECDALAYGLALRSETQLASLVGCEFEFNARDRNWTPRRDAAGRGSVPGVYVAGDGAAIAGADAAELAGERAALALLEDIGQPVDAQRARELESHLAANSRIRTALERAFPFPEDWAASIADDTVICRCEEVTAGTVRRAVHDTAAQEMNRVKALTRVGMGRCQGRMCGAATAEVLAQACGRTPAEVGRLRNQPPVKPVPVRVVCLERQEKVSA
ncbi:NAD(P)/FAD-dependent oxidoreductase [Achromobacter sp. JUb104]|uniref:FAD/NAD(P)-dependent oxidoreductase n=1 Tax=Achromobacter sp. JUb104 TaxID=2940590 RepID=UPI00216A1CC6|nr:NAD(P)/FAD-dependent oxidoreductase [Achromobacter sp. JUb104]MCS3508131.1 NADPH-dependent 2,4-dienoyl-CoA reductase/sulfur reductase-like enzyme [Achromobacter sp. JUb104]